MRRKIPIRWCAVCLGALMSLAAGCESQRVSLARKGVVTLEPHAEGKVRVVWSDAYPDEKGFTVTGVVRRQDTVGVPIRVNVQVTILAPDGSTWAEGWSDDLYVPRRMVSKAQGFERFQLSFANVPPAGSSVLITPRSGPSL